MSRLAAISSRAIACMNLSSFLAGIAKQRRIDKGSHVARSLTYFGFPAILSNA
jgi:hypothetical protein